MIQPDGEYLYTPQEALDEAERDEPSDVDCGCVYAVLDDPVFQGQGWPELGIVFEEGRKGGDWG